MLRLLITFSLLSVVLTVLSAPTTLKSHISVRSAPNVPSGPDALVLLNGLAVAVKGSQDGYSRPKFPLWLKQNGTCNTREVVLQRDGTDVVVNSACHPISGSWYSPYDAATWTKSVDVQIDHLVPLSEAWKSGAAAWDTPRRAKFANDLVNPQLWAVTGRVNEAKGDSDPSQWMPPLSSFHCTYACAYTKVKSVYGLTVTSSEKSALASAIATC